MSKVFGWLLGIGTFVGALYILWSKKNKVESIEDALEAQRLKQQIAKDEATVADMLVKAEIAVHQREPLEAIITESKARVAGILAGKPLSEMTESEAVAAFRDAGF
jgi:uncharacterized Tic20 family protein